MSHRTPSTYASTVGENSAALWFIDHLGLTTGDFGRFRDAALYREDVNGSDGKGLYVIRVLTRNAGSKTKFKPVNETLEQHPLFIRTEFDPTDDGKTYQYFFFSMPESMREELKSYNVDLDIAYESKDTALVDNRNLRTKISDARAQRTKPTQE